MIDESVCLYSNSKQEAEKGEDGFSETCEVSALLKQTNKQKQQQLQKIIKQQTNNKN